MIKLVGPKGKGFFGEIIRGFKGFFHFNIG